MATKATALAAAAMTSTALALVIVAYHQGKRCGRFESEVISRASESDEFCDASQAAVCSNCNGNGCINAAANRAESEAPKQRSKPSDELDMLPIYPIGTLQSIYRLCVGTPRQGMLAPHSRGIITFQEHKVSKDSILELQHFSHVFVVFVFHLNSNANVRQNTFGKEYRGEKNQSKRQFPSKIAPPSLGGKKVGVFSTRTPHRPNPIGFSLCKLDKVVVNNGKTGSTFSLLLSGLDIVDGTPILDIKPYVPHYDCVGYDPARNSQRLVQPPKDYLAATTLIQSTNPPSDDTQDVTDQMSSNAEQVRVPYWVDSGLQKRRNVTFLPEAEDFLESLICTNCRYAESSLDGLQFYGPKSPWKDSPKDAVEHLRNCMHELLGVDVRSAWQTKKARKGKFQAERASRVKNWKGETATTSAADEKKKKPDSLCTQQIDNLLLKFTIEEPGSEIMGTLDERSKGSGAEDAVVVHSISIINARFN